MENRKTLLHNLNIYDTIHRFDKWGCGCDYLRMCYKERSDYIEDKFLLLDTDNSNFCTDEIGGITFTLQKDYTPIGTALNFIISYNDVAVPVGQFVKFNKNTSYNTKSYGKFDFYGSMFRLIDMGFLQKSIFLLLKVKLSSEEPKITRFDYRLDFFSMKEKSVPSPEKFLKYVHKQSKIREWKKGNGVYESWDIGKNSRNNRYALRFYDKLIDSNSKEKVFLYQDYFMYKSVVRFEIEFQPNFLKGYTFYDFYDGLIQDRIESILGLSERLFKGPLFYQYVSDYTIQEKDKIKYLKRYSTMTVRLGKNGINPLIQGYKAIFYELESDELNKYMSEFLDFIHQDKQSYKLRYELMKKEFLDLHKIN